jgi:hypothetical protein
VRHEPDSCLSRLRAGAPFDHVPVVDFHTHVGNASRYYDLPEVTAEGVLGWMRRFGVQWILTFALSTTTDPLVKNRYVHDMVAGMRGRAQFLTTLHAGFPGDWRGLLEDGASKGTRGIKLLSQYQGVRDDALDWSEAFGFARGRGWVVLHHDWGEPAWLRMWAERYPDVTFVIGHASLRYREIVASLANVYQCTCAAFVTPDFASIEDMVRAMPLEKLLFGSDYVDLDMGTALGPIAYADVPVSAKERILGRNAIELARRLGWSVPPAL